MERTDVILLLLADISQPVVGTTRLQKLLFLIEHETNLNIEGERFDFKPYLYGPASNKIYDDLNFLENLGYIERSGEEQFIKNLNLNDIENYNAEMFLSSHKTQNVSNNTDNIENELDNEIDKIENELDKDDLTVYRLTEKGMNYLKERELSITKEKKSVQKILSTYGKKSLINLLQYVYSKYPEYTVESTIKDKL